MAGKCRAAPLKTEVIPRLTLTNVSSFVEI